MTLSRSRFFGPLLIAIGALLSPLQAQVGGLADPDWGRMEAHATSTENDADSKEGGAPPAGDLIATDGMVFIIPGVINLEDLSGSGILFGAGLSQGYGSVHSSLQGDPKGAVTVASPYVGLYQSGHVHKVLLEYSPTVDLFNQNRYDGSVLQRGGLRGFDNISERWGWVFSTYATYGQEYLRELSGLATGEYPGWLTFSFPTDTLLLTSASTGLVFRRTLRQDLSFMVGDTYSAIKHGPHFDASTARVQLTSYFGHDSKWYIFTDALHSSNQSGCNRVGTGTGFVLNLNAYSTLSMEGAPEFGTGNCLDRVTVSYNGSLAEHLSPWTVFYLSATRDMVEPYRLQSRWMDIFSAKIRQKTSQNTDISLGSGYARSSDFPGTKTAEYRGFLLFSEFQWRLSDSLDFVTSYRYFKRDLADGFNDKHHWVFCSIVWHPIRRGRHAH